MNYCRNPSVSEPGAAEKSKPRQLGDRQVQIITILVGSFAYASVKTIGGIGIGSFVG